MSEHPRSAGFSSPASGEGPPSPSPASGGGQGGGNNAPSTGNPHPNSLPLAGEGTEERAPLLEARDLKKHFPIHSGLFSRATGKVNAVDGV